MMRNKFFFQEECAYTYKEVMHSLMGDANFFTKVILCQVLASIGSISINDQNTQITSNDCDYSFLSTGAIDEKVQKNAVSVLNKVILRYGEHYAVMIPSEEAEALYKASQSFFMKVANVLDYTFDKYNTLLSIYAEQKAHLLDKLQRIREEEKSSELSGSNSLTGTDSTTGSGSGTRATNITENRTEDNSSSESGSFTENQDEEHSITKETELDGTTGTNSKTASSDTPQTINVSQDAGVIQGYFNKFDTAQQNGTTHSEGIETDNGTSGIDKTGSSSSQIDEDKSMSSQRAEQETTSHQDSTSGTTSRSGSSSSEGSESSEATESFDPMTMMARIEEIQSQYENTMFKWVEEFDRLFIEEGNI